MNAVAKGSVEVTWLGHGTWQFRHADHTVLVDPFLSNNPAATVSAQQVDCQTILVTHGHFDHIDDCVAIAQRCNAKVFTSFEVANWLEKQGVSDPIGMNIGGAVTHQDMRLKMTPAVHSSSLPDGTYGGLAAGFLVTVEDKKLYFAGDTAVFHDMKYLSDRIDLAVLPIGDLFTMGPADSLQAIEWLRPRRVTGGHVNTWPPIEQDLNAWSHAVQQQGICEPIIAQVGQPFVIN